jgi:Pyoverdine/dityrosine biosynthesis protein
MENLAFERTIAPQNTVAQQVLTLIMQYRRTPNEHANCGIHCSSCHAPHFNRVTTAVAERKPITFVLPAFPGKSPNLNKVLSTAPDMAEELALKFLDNLCEQIKTIHQPGAKIILCSDGRVFSDVVGLHETDVTNYQDELEKMIADNGLTNISTFNLDEICNGKDFSEVRSELMNEFGATLESLREKILRGSTMFSQHEDQEAHRMYLGITRFLLEDAIFPGQTKSRNALQKESKAKSYEVIRRSNAWSELIAERFPEAVRLSIHPQGCGAKKLGLRLIGNESWMTPWHGVAVKTNEGFTLLKRSDAEALGAKLVFSPNGRPSYFELANEIHNEVADEV